MKIYIVMEHGCQCGRSHVISAFVDEEKAKTAADDRAAISDDSYMYNVIAVELN